MSTSSRSEFSTTASELTWCTIAAVTGEIHPLDAAATEARLKTMAKAMMFWRIVRNTR